MYLVDSDVLINFLKRRTRCGRYHQKITSPIALYQYHLGRRNIRRPPRNKNKKKLNSFKELLKSLTVVNIDFVVIEKFASVRKFLRKKGLLIDNLDLLIASTCLAYDLSLVTRNTNHFKRIPDLKMNA